MGDYKSPGFHRSNLFFTADCKSAGTPRGRLFSGRLAEDSFSGRLAEDFSLDASRKTFLWTPRGRLFSGRLAEDFSLDASRKTVSLDASRKTFLWTPRGRLFSGCLAEDSFFGCLAEDFASIPLGVSTDLQSVV